MTQLIDKIAIPTFVINKDRKITHWNKALMQLTGLDSNDMIGTSDQWKPFYSSYRPTMADLIIDGDHSQKVDQFYRNKYHPCDVLDGAFAAEDFFPEMGNDGEWLSFTASPIEDEAGHTVGAIETLVNISDRKNAELELIRREQLFRELSITDELTQLYNIRCFHQEIGKEIRRCERYNHQLALCLFDLDHFKPVNDTYGHVFGDQVLAEFGRLVTRHLRTTDSGFRYGGEEFVVLMPFTPDGSVATERIRLGLENKVFISETSEEVRLTVSGGIANYRIGDKEETLVKRADKALYQSKENGRNQITML